MNYEELEQKYIQIPQEIKQTKDGFAIKQK